MTYDSSRRGDLIDPGDYYDALTDEQRDLHAILQVEAREVEKRLWFAFPEPAFVKNLEFTWERVLSELINLAYVARNLAIQYRAFNVGAVLMGLRNVRPGENPWIIAFAANTKPTKSDKKYCAEQRLLDEAGRRGVVRTIAIVVVGEPQRDDDSKRDQPTLTPCNPCRYRFYGHLGVPAPGMNDDTWIISADFRMLGIRKYQKRRDLSSFHCEVIEEDE